jgi:hypothetical protein
MSGNTQQYDTVKEALKSEEQRLKREREKEHGILFGGWIIKEDQDTEYSKKGTTNTKKKRK